MIQSLNFDSQINSLDTKMSQLQKEIQTLNEEKKKLAAEKMEAEKLNRTKEQDELVDIRELIKLNIDKYNDLANKSNIKSSIGLLTKGGHNVYYTNEDNETSDGEYFYDGDYTNFNKYPEFNGWFPSSINC